MEGDKGTEVASVWVVKTEKYSIQHDNRLPAEEGYEGRLSPPLDARVDRIHRLRQRIIPYVNNVFLMHPETHARVRAQTDIERHV